MATASEYVLQRMRDGAEFTLYRARQDGNPRPLLVVAPSAVRPSPQSLRRLEHEYSLADELDPAWSAKPLALTRYEGRTILVLADPGGEPLDLVLERAREQPFDLARRLRLAIHLTAALGNAHQRDLIHRDVKPENVLVALEPSGDAGDARSDLYSLGVTLYEMLTGVLPFEAADPLEWVHCHIERQSVSPADSDSWMSRLQ